MLYFALILVIFQHSLFKIDMSTCRSVQGVLRNPISYFSSESSFFSPIRLFFYCSRICYLVNPFKMSYAFFPFLLLILAPLVRFWSTPNSIPFVIDFLHFFSFFFILGPPTGPRWPPSWFPSLASQHPTPVYGSASTSRRTSSSS